MLSSKLENIKPSITLLLAAKANKLRSQGCKLISFGVGEPDSETPDNVKLAGINAILQGQTRYTNEEGTVELKGAVQAKFKKENNLDYDLDEIIISCGGKHVIYNLFSATLNPGDEVIIPKPYWVSYPEMVALCLGNVVFADCDINFKLTPEELDARITPKTKWLILNSPSNPSGAAYSKQELLALAQVLDRHPHVYVMSDDIYEHVMFDGLQFYTLAQLAPNLRERIFIVNGVSKAYSMTGWRIGYGAGNKKIISAMKIVQSQSTSNPCSISQVAAMEALNGRQDFIDVNRANLENKRNLAMQILADSAVLKCNKPNGAFYLFVDARQVMGKSRKDGGVIANSSDLCDFLLENANVVVVPGAPFGLEGFFRLSFATSVENITQGCKQIVQACKELS